jgi:DegV family protein with EDD domain
MVKIITDTTSCLSPDIARRFDIPVIPQVVNFGEESYLEGVNLDNATFMKKIRTCQELPKTAAPPPELFSREFQRFVPLGEPILCIHPSIDVSGTVRSAKVAAMDFPQADIRIIDTRLIASPLGDIVEQAAICAADGLTADQIVRKVTNLMRRARVYFLVSTLDYLARGGRIGNASALLGGILQIKPILTMRYGKVDQYEKERTYKRAFNRLIEIVCEQSKGNHQNMVSVMHADVPDEALKLAKELKNRLNLAAIPAITDVPPAIVTHGGPGILAVGFFVASPKKIQPKY